MQSCAEQFSIIRKESRPSPTEGGSRSRTKTVTLLVFMASPYQTKTSKIHPCVSYRDNYNTISMICQLFLCIFMNTFLCKKDFFYNFLLNVRCSSTDIFLYNHNLSGNIVKRLINSCEFLNSEKKGTTTCNFPAT